MDEEPKAIGGVLWQDLTVANADELRTFYGAVIGWQPRDVEMGGYADYEMISPTTGDTVAGICHARGVNADIPPQWLIYFSVASLKESIAQCVALGGAVIAGPRNLGDERFCVIQDPSGAVCALLGPD